jgi:hypothetical protein
LNTMPSQFTPKRLGCPAEPKNVQPEITKFKKIQITVPLGESGSHPLSFGALMSGVPGGLTYWSKFRVDKVHIWGPDTINSDADNQISVNLSASSAWNQPNFQITDSGTLGRERARLGFQLGLLDKARWFDVASAELLCLITGPANTSCVVQADIQIISPSLASS